jgi:hypothetical protein
VFIADTSSSLCCLLQDIDISILYIDTSEGKGVKQDNFKALKFYQKACDLNNGSGALKQVSSFF